MEHQYLLQEILPDPHPWVSCTARTPPSGSPVSEVVCTWTLQPQGFPLNRAAFAPCHSPHVASHTQDSAQICRLRAGAGKDQKQREWPFRHGLGPMKGDTHGRAVSTRKAGPGRQESQDTSLREQRGRRTTCRACEAQSRTGAKSGEHRGGTQRCRCSGQEGSEGSQGKG